MWRLPCGVLDVIDVFEDVMRNVAAPDATLGEFGIAQAIEALGFLNAGVRFCHVHHCVSDGHERRGEFVKKRAIVANVKCYMCHFGPSVDVRLVLPWV